MDSIFDKIDFLSQSHRDENLKALRTYHTKIRKLISEMNETVKQNEKLLKSIKLSEVRNYQSKLKEYEDLPEHLDTNISILYSETDHGKELNINIGDFRALLKQQLQISLPAELSRLTKRIGGLKDKARVIATIPTDYKSLLGFACVGDAEAWIYGNTQTITRIDINGTVKDTVITTCWYGPQDMALTRE